MNIALWIAAGLLSAMFLMAGINKVTKSKEDLAKMLPWTADYSLGFTRFIGAAEVLGALGLILPGIFKIAGILTPIAAVGLALIMLFAAIFHAKRKETGAIGMNVALLLIAAFVAWGRFGAYAF